MAQRLAEACPGYRILSARGESGKRARLAGEKAQRMRTVGVPPQMSALSSPVRGRAGKRTWGDALALFAPEHADTLLR
jgi:hypothetical protein